MAPEQLPAGARVEKDGRSWRLGTAEDVAWIVHGTTVTREITAAIPPVFEAYATFDEPEREDAEEHNRAVLGLLGAQTPALPWWLGYLDTGADDIVFPGAPMTTLYAGWQYVLVEAGPEQAAGWRGNDSWRGALPNLVFPADRSWLLSTLWDDDWRCLGGPVDLIASFQADARLRARAVQLGEDATPPGHKSW